MLWFRSSECLYAQVLDSVTAFFILFSKSRPEYFGITCIGSSYTIKFHLYFVVAESGSRLRTIEEPELAATILQWIWEMSKTKVMELIEKFQALTNEIFRGRESKKGNTVKNEDQLEDKVRSSLLLTVVILLIVVIARSNGVWFVRLPSKTCLLLSPYFGVVLWSYFMLLYAQLELLVF